MSINTLPKYKIVAQLFDGGKTRLRLQRLIDAYMIEQSPDEIVNNDSLFFGLAQDDAELVDFIIKDNKCLSKVYEKLFHV